MVGSPTITIEGVDELSPVEHEVIPDRIEAATFLAAVGVAGGEIVIEGARPDHMDMLVQKLGNMGVRSRRHPDGVWAMARGAAPVDVSTLPYPGVATDYKPLLVSMLAVADGVGIVTENMFAGRFRYVDELVRMGADIRTEDHYAIVPGRRAALRGAGAGPRHPGRGRPGRRRLAPRARPCRRRPPHRPGLRALRREAPAIGADVERRD